MTEATSRPRLLNLDQAEPLARAATYKALKEDARWSALRETLDIPNLILGSRIGRKTYAFELYVAGERRQDALIFTRAVVDRATGEVMTTLFLDAGGPHEYEVE